MTKIVLVTGANRGIGHEIARQLAEKGHQVIAGSRKVGSVKELFPSVHSNIDLQILDVNDLDSIHYLKEYIEKQYGHLDVLINNAGIISDSLSVFESDLKDMEEVIKSNYIGPWRMMNQFHSLLIHSKDPRIINMSSGMGSIDGILSGSYAAYRQSKYGLNGLTRQAASEANGSIKINAMCPGWVRTDMGGQGASRHVEKGAETAVYLALEENIPNGKFLRDKEIIDW